MEYAGMTEAEHCGQRVKFYRRQRGLSLRQLGKLADFSHQEIDKVERGEMNVGIHTLTRIAHALDVPLSNILGTPGLAETLALVTWAQSDAPDVLVDVAQRLQRLANDIQTLQWPVVS